MGAIGKANRDWQDRPRLARPPEIGKATRDWQGRPPGLALPVMAADPPIGPGTRRGAASASAGARDRPPARVAASGVFLLAAGALAWMHRDDIFPPEAL